MLRASSDLAGGGDARGVVSHEVQNQAEDSLCETCGDGDGQNQNGDEYKRFH